MRHRRRCQRRIHDTGGPRGSRSIRQRRSKCGALRRFRSRQIQVYQAYTPRAGLLVLHTSEQPGAVFLLQEFRVRNRSILFLVFRRVLRYCMRLSLFCFVFHFERVNKKTDFRIPLILYRACMIRLC